MSKPLADVRKLEIIFQIPVPETSHILDVEEYG
jgi:hypothetical protein